MTGALMIGLPDSVVVKGTLRSVKEHLLDHEILSAAEINARYPVMNPHADEIGVLESEGGYLVPENCIAAYLQQAAVFGATIRFEEEVQHWANNASGVEIVTTRGRYRAKKLVLAVGAWAPQMYGSTIPVDISASRRVLFWIKPEKEASLATFDVSFALVILFNSIEIIDVYCNGVLPPLYLLANWLSCFCRKSQFIFGTVAAVVISTDFPPPQVVLRMG
jgi:glycine/D-amino acid oxidase-like deaminating enzyme